MEWLLGAAVLWLFFGGSNATRSTAAITPVQAPALSAAKKAAKHVSIARRHPAVTHALVATAANKAGVPPTTLKQSAVTQAQAIADMVRTQGANYDGAKLYAWQFAAGCKTQNGNYDAATQQCLTAHGAKNVPTKTYQHK